VIAAIRLTVAACLVWYVVGLPSVPRVSPRPAVVQPEKEMRDIVRPVTAAVAGMNAVDRLWLKTIYENAARVVREDGEEQPYVIETTAGLREIHIAILKFVWKGLADNEPGKYPGLAEAISEAVTSAVGLDQRPLTPELRDRASKVFEAIAWAGLGEG
jgi:hypothetical protein